MRNLPALSVILLASVALGCGNDNFCDRNSKCKNQPATDRSDGGACAAKLNQYPQCTKQNEEYLECWLDHEVCTPDGKTDVTGTLGYAASQCVDQKTKLDTCIATDGGTK